MAIPSRTRLGRYEVHSRIGAGGMAYKEHSFSMTLLKVEPRWDSLRSDPRVAVLLRRVGLPQ